MLRAILSGENIPTKHGPMMLLEIPSLTSSPLTSSPLTSSFHNCRSDLVKLRLFKLLCALPDRHLPRSLHSNVLKRTFQVPSRPVQDKSPRICTVAANTALYEVKSSLEYVCPMVSHVSISVVYTCRVLFQRHHESSQEGEI